MPSAFASAFNTGARALLWKTHKEALGISLDGQSTTTIDGIWKRVQADGAQAPDGAGLITYTGQALLVVKVADMPVLPGPATVITRNGEAWTVRHVEPQDEWTLILHLSRRKGEQRAVRK